MKKRVVLVDDDQITNLVNRKFIERQFSDVTVETFCSGYAAIEFLRKVPPPEKVTILLDINMPEFSGWCFMKTLEEEFPDAPFSVHILTSSTDSRDISKSQEFEMVRSFLSKPLTVKNIENLGIG